MRVGLVGCSARKLAEPAPAERLYVGDLFKLSRAWIAPRVDAWAILSAKHGLVMPDDVIEPYDLALSSMRSAQRDEWAERVRQQLLDKWGDQAIYMILAGGYYTAALHGMPMVEDVIWHWTQQRRLRGMRKPSMGIGVIMRELKSGRGFGA